MMYELIPHIELYKQQIYMVTIQATITLLDKLTSFSPKKGNINRGAAWMRQEEQMRTYRYIQKCIGVIESKRKPCGAGAS